MLFDRIVTDNSRAFPLLEKPRSTIQKCQGPGGRGDSFESPQSGAPILRRHRALHSHMRFHCLIVLHSKTHIGEFSDWNIWKLFISDRDINRIAQVMTNKNLNMAALAREFIPSRLQWLTLKVASIEFVICPK
jgi:hypothetical protein